MKKIAAVCALAAAGFAATITPAAAAGQPVGNAGPLLGYDTNNVIAAGLGAVGNTAENFGHRTDEALTVFGPATPAAGDGQEQSEGRDAAEADLEEGVEGFPLPPELADIPRH